MNRTYPKPVVLRKGIVLSVIAGSFLVLSLILYNLYQSSINKNFTMMRYDASVQSYASGADTNWYQHKSVKKLDDQKTIMKPAKQELKPTVWQKEIAIKEKPETLQMTQEAVKAMGAPITSNQLLAEGSAISNNNTVPSNTNESSNTDSDQNLQGEKKGFLHGNQFNDDYLSSSLQSPISPFELQAGTVVPGVLITGINSGLPGQITGQVRENVYDSISGKYLLIPQGAKLQGLYDSQIAYGQERVLVVWKRIIFPNGQSINLQGMPGVDLSGYAGFNDQVNNHYDKIFGSVILMSVLGAGAQLAQPQNNANPFAAPTVGQTLAQSLGTNLANTGTMITSKNINIQPTLEIRPGYEFNISVTKDMVFPGEYHE